MLRSALKIGGITLAVLLVLAATLTGWTLHRLQAHLEPPPNPPGQPSIASYANAATPAADIEPGSPLSGTLAGFDWSRIDHPPIAARPWTRWWWLGSQVDEAGLVEQMQQYADAGLGGVELTPIYGVQGAEADF
ncbi:MAG: hypothetical protein KDI09_17250, partial [Halioglobus sp.]|nr:hypothetical protein [Halioglobus sp.]